MKLWGGRFQKGTSGLMDDFHSSISFDQRLFEEDILGSIAHATMLGKQGIISEADTQSIVEGLKEILADAKEGSIQWRVDAEDIHMNVESILTERIGEAGKRLHTGRSRNDQVALDMHMYARKSCKETIALLVELISTLIQHAEQNIDTIMPGYTHLQKAQPITLAHHLMAYVQMFLRDRSRLHDMYRRMNLCPLGAGALAGTTYPLDREYSAALLGFDGATRNSMDSVSDRDYLIEFLSDLSMIMMHLSRFCEEIILWNSNEYRFIELDDAYSTGSSIMPQKKNPDIAELVRGKTGRVYGALMQLLTTMKGLPLAYNKDMQEDKEFSFDAVDTACDCLKLFEGMLSTTVFNKERMEESAKKGFTNATDAADYLVRAGVPFRDAHGIVGRLVLTCIERGIALDDLPLEEYQKESSAFGPDIYDAISMKTCVSTRNTKGAPGPQALEEMLAQQKSEMEKLDKEEGFA